MCSMKNGRRSPLPVKLAKVTVILVFFCFAECAAGSCLSYGHACWGAHGKRGGGSMPMHAANRAASPPSRWYLSRLLQTPLGQYYLRSSQNYYGAGANNAADDDGGEQAFAVDAGADAAAEAHKGHHQDSLNKIQDLLTAEDEDISRANDAPTTLLGRGGAGFNGKLRGLKFLEKRSTKLH